MCDVLAELGEEGNEDYVVCNCLHSVIACLAFQVFDFFAVLITLLAYTVACYLEEASIHSLLPFFALVIFAAAFPTGIIGLLRERANLLVIYNARLSLMVLWSLSWMVVSLLTRSDVIGLVTSLVWFLGALLYFWGLFVTSKALTYVTTHYRGYDDVDPERVQFIEQMLRDMIDEIKQKELDIAAGAIIRTTESIVEQKQEVTAKNPSE